LNYSTDHYGERGYRFCLLEAGHIVQNIMLVAEALDKAVTPIGGFKDDNINQNVLPSDKRLSALYLVPVGEGV
jgi:SagB-type dehydrogenase family enzyme